MHHPEIVIVPALMLADYYLTMWGAKLAAERYRQHVKSPFYELNPMWRGDVARLRLFNPRHLFLVVLVLGLLWLLSELAEPGQIDFTLIFGCVLGPLMVVLARHISNILLFRFLAKHPDDIQGEVTYSARMLLMTSIYQNISTALILAAITLAARSAFVFGATLGVVGLIIANTLWLRRIKTDPKVKAAAFD